MRKAFKWPRAPSFAERGFLILAHDKLSSFHTLPDPSPFLSLSFSLIYIIDLLVAGARRGNQVGRISLLKEFLFFGLCFWLFSFLKFCRKSYLLVIYEKPIFFFLREIGGKSVVFDEENYPSRELFSIPSKMSHSELEKPLVSPSSSRKLPDFKQSVKLKYVKLGYHYLITHGMYLFLAPMIVVIAAHLWTLSIRDFYVLWDHLRFNLISVILCSTLLVFLSTLYFLTRPCLVYLVNFSCYKPEAARQCTRQIFVERSRLTGSFSEESIQFQKKILERSGLSESTYLPEAVLRVPPNPCMEEARKEAEVVMYGAIDELLAKTSVKPKDIGILIVNCSLFNPTPSLSAMVINHYKLRGNIISHNLGGMGCSAGLISIDLAKDLLQVHPNTYALVISMENITLNWYFGNDKSMLLPNCLFRMGGAAVLLSNRRRDWHRSKYQLVHTVRTHKGSDDKCFSCIYQVEDPNGKLGVSLSKDLMAVAGDALKTNITTLGPLVLPMSEQLLFFATLVGKKLFKMKIKPYIPDFKLAFEHFCIHAGGRAVLDEIEKNLRLSDWNMEPSRMTLYRFGNTSSSSLWYELAYTEAKGRMKKGDRTWQIAFGSGFKCNSAVWKALRTINPTKEKNPWMDEIHQFPVDVPKFSAI